MIRAPTFYTYYVQPPTNADNEFSYIDMIKYLIKHGDMEEPELEGDFTDAETSSVKSMVIHINEELDRLKQQWTDEE